MTFRKNEMLEYLKIMEWKLVNIFSTHSVFLKISNVNWKGYVNKKLNEEMDSEDTHLNKEILDSFKFKRLAKIKVEELSEGNKEHGKSEPEETEINRNHTLFCRIKNEKMC